MNKNIVKTFSIIFIIFMLVFTFSIPAFADTNNFDLSSTDAMSDLNDAGDSSGLSTSAQKIAGAILNTVKIIAMAMALIMLAVLAIKYMSAAPNDKAEIKKHAVVYIVGALCLFGASGILQIIQNFAGYIG